jgi:transcriptional regulator GlxA family with amidase domain
MGTRPASRARVRVIRSCRRASLACTRDPELSARLSRVHARFAEPVCLADLASVAEMSVFHLVRQFHRYYGMPPYRYLELVRVQHAKGMLRRGARISTSPLRWGSAIRVI